MCKKGINTEGVTQNKSHTDIFLLHIGHIGHIEKTMCSLCPMCNKKKSVVTAKRHQNSGSIVLEFHSFDIHSPQEKLLLHLYLMNI